MHTLTCAALRRTPNEPRDATAAAADQLRRWHAACAALEALPAHRRFSQLPPHSHDRLCRLAAAAATPDALRGAAAAAAAAPVVVQLALHSPDAHLTKTQTLLARTEHTLAQVADAVQCANDRYARDALGDDAPCGGLFSVGGTLYADTRQQGRRGYVDHTPELLQFMRDCAADACSEVGALLTRKGLGALAHAAAARPAPELPAVRPMHATRLAELEAPLSRAGACLYVHAGACEHVVVFEDARASHKCDPDTAAGPARLGPPPVRLEKCCVCLVRPAARVAMGDALAPESPAFFCARCFDDLHCDAAGARLPGSESLDVFAMY